MEIYGISGCHMSSHFSIFIIHFDCILFFELNAILDLVSFISTKRKGFGDCLRTHVDHVELAPSAYSFTSQHTKAADVSTTMAVDNDSNTSQKWGLWLLTFGRYNSNSKNWIHFVGHTGLFTQIPAYTTYVWEKLFAKA